MRHSLKPVIARDALVPMRALVFAVSFAILVPSFPRPAGSWETLPRGRATAREAAALAHPPDRHDPPVAAGWTATFAAGDTTAAPESEETEERNLYKEVALWVIVGGFVAYFIIEVFLRGDTDETPPEDGGKPIPVSFILEPRPAARE